MFGFRVGFPQLLSSFARGRGGGGGGGGRGGSYIIKMIDYRMSSYIILVLFIRASFGSLCVWAKDQKARVKGAVTKPWSLLFI